MIKKILIGYQKGGVGKTTIAANLAYYLQSINPNNKDNQVLLVDGDSNQISSTQWAFRRRENSSIEQKIECVDYEQYEYYNKEFNYVVFDITGQLEALVRTLKEQDINTLIIPISLSDLDLDPIVNILESLDSYSVIQNDLKVFLFINKNYNDRVKNEVVRSRILKIIDDFKSKGDKHIQIDLLINSIGDIKTIQEEMGQGLSSLELSKKRRSYIDFDRLTIELNEKGAFK